ncbi:MAG: DUF799 domain-containing protein [Zoogloeaceae bacterium]|jgi:hypothetical protein|nr:DUF799 domain-containing protein [Zoogloeaceae bacterium]
MPLRFSRFLPLAGIVLFMSACVTTQPSQYDYTAFRQSAPRSILVLPPVNRSPEITATAEFLSTTTLPLAESGYYVLPVAVTAETFRQNGVTIADDAHELPLPKLREIFGADSALYITIERYGVSYRLIESVTEVGASARLVDLRSGTQLWDGRVYLAQSSNQNNSGNNLLSMLLNAVLHQIINASSEQPTLRIAHAAGAQLLYTNKARNGILYGPHHPNYRTD